MSGFMALARAQSALARKRWQRYRFGSRAIVLAYHRVADVDRDPLGLCVTPRRFEQHLDVLRQYGRPVRFDALRASLESPGRAGEYFCVTLDDGYIDSLYQAKPIMERCNTPATVFVATGQIDSGREFWWDQLTRLASDAAAVAPAPGTEHSGPASKPSDDEAAAWRGRLSAIHEKLGAAPPAQREALLDELLDQHGVARSLRSNYRTLDSGEVSALADGGLIEIGAHSVSHSPLDCLDEAQQRAEIFSSKRLLEEMLGRRILSFAYPHGRYTDRCLKQVAAAGFEQACTTEAGLVWPTTERFRIPRFVVGDWDGGELARRLAHWFGKIGPERPLAPQHDAATG